MTAMAGAVLERWRLVLERWRLVLGQLDWGSTNHGCSWGCKSGSWSMEEEVLGEFMVRVRASMRRGEESLGDEEEGPKIRRSLNSEGVRGRATSSSSGRGKRGDGRLFLGLT